MGMRTARPQAATAASVRPWPSLPMTTHSPPANSRPTVSSAAAFCSAAARQVTPRSRSARSAAGRSPVSNTGMRTAAPIEARSVRGA